MRTRSAVFGVWQVAIVEKDAMRQGRHDRGREAKSRSGKLARASLLLFTAMLAFAGSMGMAAAQAPTVSASFGAATIQVGDTTRLSFKIKNNTPRTNSLVAFADSLPPGLVVATPPGVVNSCGGIVSANAGSNLFQISGVVVDPRSSCTVSVNVTAVSAGVKNNITTPVTSAVGRGPGGSIAITVFAPSTSVASVSPTTGTTSGGTQITITGTNLISATAVTIGGVAAKSFTIVNSNTITAITPAHAAGDVDVVVSTPRGTATGRALYTYDSVGSLVPVVVIGGAVAAGLAVGIATLGGGTEAPPLYPSTPTPVVPAVTSISPGSGTIMGGTSVTIKGANLNGATTVRIVPGRFG